MNGLKYIAFNNKVGRKKVEQEVEQEVEIKRCKLTRGCKVSSHNDKFKEKSRIEGRLHRIIKLP